jgi:hypothetical protein
MDFDEHSDDISKKENVWPSSCLLLVNIDSWLQTMHSSNSHSYTTPQQRCPCTPSGFTGIRFRI